MNKARYILFLILVATLEVGAQCTGGTPTFIVDLSNNPDSLWISTAVQRDGECCGGADQNCVEFVITLHPDANGILFNIYSGAEPSGALFYQQNCGPITTVGEPLCINGGETDTITFCKPGNNINEYSIQSISEPDISPPIAVNDGCIGELFATGYDDTTIVWQSISPGAPGAYDTYLDCTEDCDTVTVTAQPGFPASVDFEVCGKPLGGCGSNYECFTTTAYFFSTLQADITPVNPTICFGSPGTTITANGSGGTTPYTYLWNTGETTQSIFVSSVGTYFVELGDTSGCPPTTDTVVVTSFANPITANAGGDQTICNDETAVSLSGSVLAASGGEWIGGNGTYNPSNTSLNTTYSPTPAEITSGVLDLSLVTTGNGSCPADTDDVQITFVDFSSVFTSTITDVSCNGFADGAVAMATSSFDSPYSYLWSNTETTQSNNGLTAGTYTVTITDTYSCDQVNSYTVSEPAILQVTLTSQTDISCFGLNDGVADITASGGTAPYTYVWSNGSNNEDPTNLSSGVQTVTVTDANSCSSTMNVTINEPADLAVNISNVNSSCGSSNGSLTALPSGGTTPFIYSWSNGGNTQTINSLAAGYYTVTVTDNNGCSENAGAGISDPVPITDITDSTHISCFGGNDGMAHVTSSAGTTPYTFNWNTGQTDSIATGLMAGTHTVTITDNVGCKSIEQVMLTQPNALQVNISSQNPSCFGGNDGTANATVSGGTTSYNYLWSNGQNSSLSTGLSSGVTAVTITDANSCTISGTTTLTDPTPIDTDTVFTNVSCKSGNNGSADVSATGGTAPYTYLWNNGTTSSLNTGLQAGTHFVTVYDANMCFTTTSVNISEPAFAINLILSNTNINCFGGNGGTATVAPSGGTTPYSYLWDANAGFQNTQTAVGLSAGTYSVTVYDANNCDVNNVGTVTVTEPSSALSLSLSITDVSCFGGSDGAVGANVSGGTPGYTYSWNNGSSAPTISNLFAGSYDVTITDNNGCTTESGAVVDEPVALLANASATSVTCFGQSDGTAQVAASGGTSPYVFNWSNGMNNTALSGLSANQYGVTVTDNNGCVDVVGVTVEEPQSLQVNVSVTDAECLGENSGAGTLNTTGGISPYAYQWDINAAFQASATATGLGAGNYSATITDQNGCKIIPTITIGEPSAVSVTTSPPSDTICPGQSSLVGALATGGNGNFTYNWSNGLGIGQTKTISPTETSVYYVTATDANGCASIPAAVTIHVIDYDLDQLTLDQNGPICEGEMVTINSSYVEQYPPYTYQWDNGLGNSLGTLTASPTENTTFRLTITDKCNNKLFDSLTVEVYELPDNEIVFSNNEGCAPLTSNFQTQSNNTTIDTYLWEFGNGLSSFSSAPSHTYLEDGVYGVTLTLTSSQGCSSTNSTPVNITVHPVPVAGIKVSPSVTDIDNPDVSFLSTSSGATKFLWSFGDGDSSIVENIEHTYADTGTYNITLIVENDFGCSDTTQSIVTVGPTYDFTVPNAFVPNPSGANGGAYDKLQVDNSVFFALTDYVEDFHLMIYNRWGELIFESFDKDIGWDGYYRGKICQQDVYVWKINVTYTDGNQQSKVGQVTLIR